jgi:RimJ/RimL family protein N-acetyltransferase
MNLETERLILRNLRESDLEDFVEYRSHPQVYQFQGVEPITREKAKLYIEEQKDAEFGKTIGRVQIAVELKSENKIIGDVCLIPQDSDARVVEGGISFSSAYHGKGFAKEASIKLFDYLFEEKNVHRIIGITDVENANCIGMLENLNFRREAEFKQSFWDKRKNYWRDEYLYAMLKDDWKSNYIPLKM